MTAHPQKPLLCVDVDGVISLFGYEGERSPVPGKFHLIDGVPHHISEAAGPLLKRLAEHYEVVWATGWEEKANEYLPHLLGLESEFPYLSFSERARLRSAHWKLDTITGHAAGRPLAWIDDCIDDECHAWASTRDAPTLLIQTTSHVGIQEEHVEALVEWAAQFQPRDPE